MLNIASEIHNYWCTIDIITFTNTNRGYRQIHLQSLWNIQTSLNPNSYEKIHEDRMNEVHALQTSEYQPSRRSRKVMILLQTSMLSAVKDRVASIEIRRRRPMLKPGNQPRSRVKLAWNHKKSKEPSQRHSYPDTPRCSRSICNKENSHRIRVYLKRINQRFKGSFPRCWAPDSPPSHRWMSPKVLLLH